MTPTTEERCPTCGSDDPAQFNDSPGLPRGGCFKGHAGWGGSFDPWHTAWHTTEDSTFREDAEVLRHQLGYKSPALDRILTSYESMRANIDMLIGERENDAAQLESMKRESELDQERIRGWRNSTRVAEAQLEKSDARLTRYEEALSRLGNIKSMSGEMDWTLEADLKARCAYAREALSEGSSEGKEGAE